MRIKQTNTIAIGCHVSAAGGIWNAWKNAKELECETFQIFTRPPMGGPAPKIDEETIERFRIEKEKYYPSLAPTTSPSLQLRQGFVGQVTGDSSLSARGGSASGGKRRRGSASRSRITAELPPLKSGSPKFSSGILRKNFGVMTRGGGERSETEGLEPQGVEFVVHCPYFVNFGSANPRIYHGSISIVSEELKRANSLGAKYVMTHLGSAKDLGDKKAFAQTKEGLTEALKKYGDPSTSLRAGGPTKFLLEIAAGAGSVIGDTFEELADLMEPLKKFKTFGGICFDTQHAYSSGYDLRDKKSVAETFMRFDKVIGLKWLAMSHVNDSKIPLAGRKDRHEHIGEGEIGKAGFGAILEFLGKGSTLKDKGSAFSLILETEHDKVKADIKVLKQLREKIKK